MLTDIFPLIFCANYLPTESVVGEKNTGEYFSKSQDWNKRAILVFTIAAAPLESTGVMVLI